MARPIGGRGEQFGPRDQPGPDTQGQFVTLWTEPKGVDRYHVSRSVGVQYATKIRNLMLDEGNLVSRLGTDLMGGAAASPVLQVVDLVRKGRKKVTVRFCTRHVEIFEYGMGAWRSFPIPFTGSERDLFAYTGWADKLLFSNGVDGLWELDFRTLVVKIVPGGPSAKHLTTFGNRVVASSTREVGEDFPLRVRWTAKNDYTRWAESTTAAPLGPDLVGGFEDLYGSPEGVTDEAMGVFPFSDSQAWLIRSRSTWSMSVSGNVLAPFRFDRVFAFVGTPFRQSIVSTPSGVIFGSRDNVHEITQEGHKLIGSFVFDEIEDEVSTLDGSYASFDSKRLEYRLACDTFVWRYRLLEEGWTTDEYPWLIRSLSRQIEGVSGIPIDNLVGTIDEMGINYPPGPINDLVYDRTSDDAMMFVPASSFYVVRETDEPRDSLLTGEETDSEIVIESGVLNLNPLKAIQHLENHLEYESFVDQSLIYEYTQDDGGIWNPLSLKDIEQTSGSEILFVKQERVSRKLRLRVRALTLGKLRLLGFTPVLLLVERPMATRRARPATILVSPNPINLQVGQTQQLSVRVLDSNGTEITGQRVTLLSSNSAIATVSGTGLVRAVSPGSFAVVASIKNVQTSTPGTITPAAVAPVASVLVLPDVSQGVVGSTQQFTATLRDAQGNVLTGRVISWATSNPEFATISPSGLATLVAEGVTAISATSEGITGGATLTVTAVPDVVDSVEVVPGSFSVTAGQTFQLTAVPKDILGNILSGKTVVWSTGAPSIATVNATGVVTAIAAGSVTITATVDGIPGTSLGTVIAVVIPVSTVTVTPSGFSLLPGQTQALTVVLKDVNGNVLTGRVISYASSNTSIATVDSGGIVTGVAQGNATITVTSEGKVGTSSAAVQAVPVASVAIAPSTFSVLAGQTQQLTATLRDANGNVLAGRAIAWGSSDITKATVSSTGLVTTIASGTVTISATSETKVGTSIGTIGAVTYSPVNSRSIVQYVPEPSISGSVVQLPLVYINSTRSTATPAFTTTLNPSGNSSTDLANLQAAINASATRAGLTVIKLANGFNAITTTGVTLPERSVAGSTIIEAVNVNSYSAEGFLVNPSLMASAPKIVSQSTAPAIRTLKRATNYRIAGVEIYNLRASSTVNYTYQLVRFGNTDKADTANCEFNVTDLSDGLVLDRCYIHGTADTFIQHAVALNCKQAAVVDCWFDEIKWSGVETKCISSWSAVGPHKIVGNYLRAASINVLYGGADPALTGIRPADIEIRRNMMDKNLSFKGLGFVAKNLLELKSGSRFLIEGNIFRNSWVEGQAGYGVNFQSLSGSTSDVTKGQTLDVTFRFNWVDKVSAAHYVGATGFDGSGLPMSRLDILHNLYTNLGVDGQENKFVIAGGGLDDIRYIHNTIVRSTVSVGYPFILDPTDGVQTSDRLVIRDNLMGSGQPYGTVFQSGGLTGTAALNRYSPSYSFDHNVIWDDPVGAGNYPVTNQFAANINAIGFTSIATGDYSLANTSTYKNDASDATDPGANWTKLQLAISGVAVGPQCGLITNQTTLAAPTLAVPLYLVPFVDPAHGTQLIRISGVPGTPFGGSVVGNWAAGGTTLHYSKDQPWNSNQTELFLGRNVNAPEDVLFLDGNTYQPIRKRFSPGPAYRWHPTDPTKMIYVTSGGDVGFWTVTTGATAVQVASGGGYNSGDMGPAEGNPSFDGRYVVVSAVKNVGGHDVCWVVDLQTNTRGPDFDLTAFGATDVDWVSISAGSGYVAAALTIGGQDRRTRVWTRASVFSGSPVLTAGGTWDLPLFGHLELGFDNAGNEIGWGGVGSSTNGRTFLAKRLDTGAEVVTTVPTSYNVHDSHRNNLRQGWGYGVVNTPGGSYLDNTIFAAKMDGTQVERYCHHRSTAASYDREPHACPSRDGKRVLFTSDWGNSSGDLMAIVCDARNICP